MDLRAIQQPLKERYRAEPDSSRITLTARGSQTDAPVACSVDLGRAIQAAEAHPGVGGQIDAPEATREEIESLHAKSERYCTVLQTLTGEPRILTELRTQRS